MTELASGAVARPVHEIGEIFAVRPVGAYTELTVICPGIAGGFQPGQFVGVSVGAPPGDVTSSMLLRRSFAISGGTPTAAYAGTISFVVATVGAGTRWLVDRQPGQRLDLIGPLGRPFPLPTEPVPVVLVGGGYGTAALIPLAQSLRAQGCDLDVVIGAATAGRLCSELAIRRAVGSVTVTTDDGSAGHAGQVTDVLAAAVQRLGAQVIYACGPMPMLRAIAAIATQHSITAQVAVEEAMACGFGVCMTCVLPVRGDDGRARFVRACTDGPVFDAAKVRFDDVGTLPADLVGADSMGPRRVLR